MTALSADRLTTSKNPGPTKAYPVAASVTIYAGGMVMIDSAGYARPAGSSLASAKGVVGIATAQADNSSGSAGDINVKAQAGWFLLAGATLGQDDVGSLVYALDDATVDETQAGNMPVAGILVEYVGASSGWVALDHTIGVAAEALN